MNTVRQAAYVGVLLAALAGLVALMMTAMVNQPEPYELSSTEVAGLPVLGSSSSPSCADDGATDATCTQIGEAEDFDMSRAAGLMQRANPDLRVQTGQADESGSVDANDATGDDPVESDDQGEDGTTSTTTETSTTKTSTRDTSTTNSPTTRPPSTTEQTEPATARADSDNAEDDSRPDDDNGSDRSDDDRDDDGNGAEDDDGQGRRNNDNTDPGQMKAEQAMQKAGGASDSGNSSTGKSSNSETKTSEFEQAVISLTNEHRLAAGCDPLQPSDSLNAASRFHSKDMAGNNFFDHAGRDGSSPGERAKASGYPSTFVAENIAWGYRTPEAVVEGWMTSQGHRSNVLNCMYVHVGIGFHDFYWTQSFGVPD